MLGLRSQTHTDVNFLLCIFEIRMMMAIYIFCSKHVADLPEKDIVVCRLKYFLLTDKKNSVALVRKRTIPTERPPPVGEVSANFYG